MVRQSEGFNEQNGLNGKCTIEALLSAIIMQQALDGCAVHFVQQGACCGLKAELLCFNDYAHIMLWRMLKMSVYCPNLEK